MNKIKILLSTIITITVIFSFCYTELSTLKIYPTLINFIFFMIFFVSSLKKETIIQKIARIQDGELPYEIKKYTRYLTYIWAIITFLIFLISLYTIFLPYKIWAIYNGLISYLIIGITFGIEYPIRMWYKHKVGFKC